MNDFIIVEITGFIMIVLGIWLLRREKRIFANAITTQAQVIEYYKYNTSRNPRKYFTMVVEYSDFNGNRIRAKEQSSSPRKKYEIGTMLSINYSREKTDFFVVSGDHSRVIIMWGMIVTGLFLMTILGFALLSN